MADFTPIPINGTAEQLERLLGMEIATEVGENSTDDQLATAKAVYETRKDSVGSVKYDAPQELTEEQQAQARENIGATEQGEYGIVIRGTKKARIEAEAIDYETETGHKTSTLRFLGYSDGSVRLSSVSDGVESFDAVNVRQLNSVVGEIGEALDLLHDYAEIVINGGVITTNERYFLIDNGVVSLNPDNVDDLPSTVGIPASICGEPVTALAEGMFQYNKTVKKIYLPESITVIPKSFCNEATNLEHIYGTENVTKISGGGFRFTRLKEANFPNLTNIGKYAFSLCCYLERANIGNTITGIPEGAFYGCESLTQIDGGSSITSIGDMGLTYTTALEKLPFADNVTNIGKFGLLGSKVKYNWPTDKDIKYGTAATYVQLNGDSTVWEDKTFTPCEIPLLSTFDQNNPEWRTAKFSNTYTDNPNDVYLNNCVACAGAVIYSAYNGVEFAAPGDFVRFVYKSDTSEGKTVANNLYHSRCCDTAFEMFGYGVEVCSYYPEDPNEKGLQYLYDSLAAGKLCAVVVTSFDGKEASASHVAVAYGINEDGDIMVVDSEPTRGMWISEPAGIPSPFGDYRAIRYSMPIQNLVTFQTSDGDRPYFVVISKPEVEA